MEEKDDICQLFPFLKSKLVKCGLSLQSKLVRTVLLDKSSDVIRLLLQSKVCKTIFELQFKE